MAILTVKPSRATVFFFVLLVAALLIKYAYGKHEQRLVVTDGPPTHTARRLLRCVLGRDGQRVLGERAAAGPRGELWARRATARLQRAVTANYSSSWPGRCAPLAARLGVRLAGRPEAQAIVARARAFDRMLREAAADRRVAIEMVERGELGLYVAALAFEVSALSDGAVGGWTGGLPPEATDLWPVREATVPTAGAFASDVEYATFATPDLLLYQSVSDRSFHAVSFDARGRAQSNRVLGRGAPVRGAWRDGAVLVASDDGDSVFLPGAEPAQLVPMPDPVRDGRESASDWHVALTPRFLWLLTDDNGALRVRATPRDRVAPWGDPVASIGGTDVMAGSVLMADPAGGDTVRVIAVRRGAVGVSIEQYVVGAPATTTANSAPAASPAAGSTAALEALPVAPVAPPAAPAPTSTPTVLVPEWPAYDPRMTTCSAGDVRYLLVRAADALSVVRVAADGAERRDLEYSIAGSPSGGRFELTCDARGALLFADMVGRPGALVHFAYGTSALGPVVLSPPRLGPAARVAGAALTSDGIVVFAVGGTLRAFRTRDRGAQWEGGEIVAAPGDGDAFELAAVAVRGDQVAVLADVRARGVRFVSRIGSHDGGSTFHGE